MSDDDCNHTPEPPSENPCVSMGNQESIDTQPQDRRNPFAGSKAAQAARLPPGPLPKKREPAPKPRYVPPRGPRPMTARRARFALDVARLATRGRTNDEIALELGCNVQRVIRVRKHPDYPRALERARASLRADSEHAAEAGRAEALEAARTVVRAYNANASGITASDAMKAAALLTQASAPTPAVYTARARKDLLSQLSPTTKALVIQELQGVDSDYLAALTDEELETLLGSL